MLFFLFDGIVVQLQANGVDVLAIVDGLEQSECRTDVGLSEHGLKSVKYNALVAVFSLYTYT